MNKLMSLLLWSKTGGLRHNEVQGLAADYIDETLSGSIAARFERHLRSCHDCNLFVATLRATVLTLRGLPTCSRTLNASGISGLLPIETGWLWSGLTKSTPFGTAMAPAPFIPSTWLGVSEFRCTSTR